MNSESDTPPIGALPPDAILPCMPNSRCHKGRTAAPKAESKSRHAGPGWEASTLWSTYKGLKTKPADFEDVSAAVRGILNRVEPILKSGGTSPTDFTLHDAGHSFRVSELMCKVIPPEVLPQLPHYELALLLLSAYLHDIGMTPERSKEKYVYQFIATGEAPALTDAERGELQAWLDDEPDGAAVPVLAKGATAEGIGLVERLTAHYIRHRHNDWSTEWIRTGLAGVPLGNYSGWLEDLVALCDSHHRRYSRLAEDCFDARRVGSPGQVVNFRYLAAVLRIADVLEFDPERTPDVVFHHRLVSDKSQIFWHKDREITPKITSDTITLWARPDSAALHRAILDTIDQIDAELRTCRKLADEKHFDRGINLTELPHRWDLPATVKHDIKPREATYEYIEGGFRPNTKKLLELLAGNQFYGNESLIAVRELLQNAFDAVKEEIAVERLRMEDPQDRSWELKLGEQHRVTLHLEERSADDDRRWWLVCTDDGVGMTKEIIENHLLVSGNARRREINSLGRRCREAGFNLARSGQFGIGVLAYFMLADRVVIQTRRSDAHDNGELNGWQFETSGVGSFGELRKASRDRHGSRVELRLKPDVLVDGIAPFFSRLCDFLRSLLVRIPCRCVLNPPTDDLTGFDSPPGWFRTPDVLADKLITQLREEGRSWRTETLPVELTPADEVEKQATICEHFEELRAEARDCLRYFPVEEGELPQKLGCYRVLIPYFDLPGGACAGYMRVRESEGTNRVLHIHLGHIFVPSAFWTEAWCGFEAYGGAGGPSFDDLLAQDRGLEQVLVEVAWESSRACNISADRFSLNNSQEANECMSWLKHRASEILAQHFSESAGDYALVNARLCSSIIPRAKHNWVLSNEPGMHSSDKWDPIKYPALSSESFKYENIRNLEIRLAGELALVVPSLRGPHDDDHYDGWSWPPVSFPPERVMLLGEWRQTVVPVWLVTESLPRAAQALGWTCSFPPVWQHLCVISRYEQVMWNEDHPLVRQLDDAALEWLEGVGEKPHEMAIAESFRKELLQSSPRASAWLTRMLESQFANVWRALSEQQFDFLEGLWFSVFGKQRSSHSSRYQPLVRLSQQAGSTKLQVVTPDGWNVEDAEDRSRRTKRHALLPDPGPEWTIEVIRPESKVKRPTRRASKRVSKKKTTAKSAATRTVKAKPSTNRKKAKRATKRPKR